MDKDRIPVIVSAARLPTGRFMGGLSSLAAPDLGGLAISAAIDRAGIDLADIEDVIMGNVVQAGVGQAPARQAAIRGGVPETVPAVTINKVCGSGLKAVMLAAQAIKAGDARVVVAGGMESMSNAPYLLRGYREGVKFGDRSMVDGLIHDGLWCAFGTCHMGGHAEYTAHKAGVSREDQDAWALASHEKAIGAIDTGGFAAEVVPVHIETRGGTVTVDVTNRPVAALRWKRWRGCVRPSRATPPPRSSSRASRPATRRASTTGPPRRWSPPRRTPRRTDSRSWGGSGPTPSRRPRRVTCSSHLSRPWRS